MGKSTRCGWSEAVLVTSEWREFAFPECCAPRRCLVCPVCPVALFGRMEQSPLLPEFRQLLPGRRHVDSQPPSLARPALPCFTPLSCIYTNKFLIPNLQSVNHSVILLVRSVVTIKGFLSRPSLSISLSPLSDIHHFFDRSTAQGITIDYLFTCTSALLLFIYSFVFPFQSSRLLSSCIRSPPLLFYASPSSNFPSSSPVLSFPLLSSPIFIFNSG